MRTRAVASVHVFQYKSNQPPHSTTLPHSPCAAMISHGVLGMKKGSIWAIRNSARVHEMMMDYRTHLLQVLCVRTGFRVYFSITLVRRLRICLSSINFRWKCRHELKKWLHGFYDSAIKVSPQPYRYLLTMSRIERRENNGLLVGPSPLTMHQYQHRIAPNIMEALRVRVMMRCKIRFGNVQYREGNRIVGTKGSVLWVWGTRLITWHLYSHCPRKIAKFDDFWIKDLIWVLRVFVCHSNAPPTINLRIYQYIKIRTFTLPSALFVRRVWYR